MTYHSQIQQDALLDRAVFAGLVCAVFVDVGANDGVALSNTYFFETERYWSGLCIEADPNSFEALQRARAATCLNIGVGPHEAVEPFLQIVGPAQMMSGFLFGISEQGMDSINREMERVGGSKRVVELPIRPLYQILSDQNIREVHYLSLDVEGLEAEILRTVDHDTVFIHAMTVECNDLDRMKNLVDAAGPSFDLVVRHRHDLFFINRASPFYRNAWKLIAAARLVQLRRAVGKFVNRSARKRRKRELAQAATDRF